MDSELEKEADLRETARDLYGHINTGVGQAMLGPKAHLPGVGPYVSGALTGAKNFFARKKPAAVVAEAGRLGAAKKRAGDVLSAAGEAIGGSPVASHLSEIGQKLVFASAVEKLAKIKKEKRRPWNVANHRSGKRPMSVDTMLKKEKDGTLQAKFAQFYGPVLPFSDESDKGAAPAGKRKMDNIPSREEIANDVKRQDAREFAATVQAPGNALNEAGVTNQPQERTASANPAYLAIMKIGGVGYEEVIFEKEAKTPYMLSDAAEKHTDLGGLGLMAASSLDRMKSQLQHPENDEQGSLMGGTAGRSGMDLTGLGMMAAPTVARLAAGHGNRFTNVANIAGLGALAIPTLDNLQAGIRARRAGVSPDEKMLLGHKAHAGLELAGLGTLAAPVVRGGLSPHSAATLAGYGTLAAPVVEDLVQHDDSKRVFRGPVVLQRSWLG